MYHTEYTPWGRKISDSRVTTNKSVLNSEQQGFIVYNLSSPKTHFSSPYFSEKCDILYGYHVCVSQITLRENCKDKQEIREVSEYISTTTATMVMSISGFSFFRKKNKFLLESRKQNKKTKRKGKKRKTPFLGEPVSSNLARRKWREPFWSILAIFIIV